MGPASCNKVSELVNIANPGRKRELRDTCLSSTEYTIRISSDSFLR